MSNRKVLMLILSVALVVQSHAQDIGSVEIMRKIEEISSQLTKMSEQERAAFRCPGQDSRVPVFNSFPEMYGDDEVSLCKNFPGLDHASVSRNPVFSKSYRDSRKTYRPGLVVVLVHVMNTAVPSTKDYDTTAKNVVLEFSFATPYGQAAHVSVNIKADNAPKGKHFRGTISGGAQNCSTVLLAKSGAVYDWKGYRMGEAKQNIGKGKFSLGDMKAGWENSRFITYLLSVACTGPI